MSEFNSPSLFELEFQAFVRDGGLDREQSEVINEEWERGRMARLCIHRKLVKECVVCYKPLKPYFPGDPQ